MFHYSIVNIITAESTFNWYGVLELINTFLEGLPSDGQSILLLKKVL
jgi:hypothetical protein